MPTTPRTFWLAVALCLLITVSDAKAQHIDADAFVVGSGTALEVAGQAQFFNSLGEPGVGGMSGNLTLFWFLLGQNPEEATNHVWGTSSGYWGGSYQYSGYQGYCYYSAINARVSFWSDGSSYYDEGQSSNHCIQVTNPPRPPINRSEFCPLVLDLNGDGIHTTGLEAPVFFWRLNGSPIASGWTDPATEDGFLWLDAETDHSVTEGELFGSRMPSPMGGLFRNGFQALELHDRFEFGGNQDGAISPGDRIWGRLRIWVDRNHDGVSQPREISPLARHSIVSLPLAREHGHTIDGQGNGLMLVGVYVRRVPGRPNETRAMVDIGFIYEP